MTYKTLEMLNVKQGDCLILRPQHCKYEGNTFLVDTGNGKYDYTPLLEKDKNLYVILTHSHADHINGFNLLLTKFELNKVKKLILPYYHNESILIAEALLNLKGMATLSDKWGLKWQLNQIISNQRLLINLEQKTEIKFVKDKERLCNHIQILNPPSQYEDYLNRLDSNNLELLVELFNNKFASEISTYLYMAKINNNIVDTPYINNLFIKHNQDQDLSNRANYFAEYLLQNQQRLISFNEYPTSEKLYQLIKQKNIKEHQACIVFKCIYNNRTFLFGGDADRSVWNRLIQENKSIKAYYFKVPHHGSKANINYAILKKINPSVALISHDNGLFGRAKDPHPNKEVLKWIEDQGIKLISTNNIIKNGKILWDCYINRNEDPNVDVVDINPF